MNSWIKRIFRAQAARNGGIVRRSRESVRKYASYSALKAEVKRRRFHLLRNGDQYLIICNKGDVRVLT